MIETKTILLTKQQAASYVNIPVREFDRLMQEGKLSRPLKSLNVDRWCPFDLWYGYKNSPWT
jgi:hypothetical protein